MEFRLRNTGEVMTDGQFRDYRRTRGGIPESPTPEWYESIGVDPVFEGPQASGGTVYQYSVRAGVEQLSDGKWYTKYILGPVFTDTTDIDGNTVTAAQHEANYKAMRDAQQAESVRNQRNNLLAQCDWTQLADSPVDKAAWATYRQALRDVPTQAGFPWTVTYPETP